MNVLAGNKSSLYSNFLSHVFLRKDSPNSVIELSLPNFQCIIAIIFYVVTRCALFLSIYLLNRTYYFARSTLFADL